MHFSRRALSQESSGAICFHMRCSEVPLIRENAYDVTMPYACWSYFYNLGVKNQDRKLKFGTSNVLIELYNIYSGFLKIPKILELISCFPKI